MRGGSRGRDTTAFCHSHFRLGSWTSDMGLRNLICFGVGHRLDPESRDP